MATIPGPRENDADDVSLALEVAQSQWARGDHAEALKWLKKAVDAAFEADDDKRGMELSKVAAEVKAEIEKPSKPKIPPPRTGGTMRPSAPPPRKPKPRQPQDDLESTGTRRTGSTKKRGKPVPQPKPSVEEDEATREYKLDDMGEPQPDATVADEWPTETIDDVGELEEVPEATKTRSKSGPRSLDKKPAKREAPKPQPKPERPKQAPAKSKDTKDNKTAEPSAVPTTRAIRVAVGRDKGAVYVRLLDAQGLRRGEHDAMLVALTSDGDIRTLFK